MRPRKRPTTILPNLPHSTVYSTALGAMVSGHSEEVLQERCIDPIRGKVQLIFTSPPFPLNTKKKYGNLKGEEYLRWLAGFGPLFRELLSPNGSIVMELGNSWEPGFPAMSTLALRALLNFQETNKLHLCQEIICFNPARLPGPAQWVTIERIRLKDSFTRLWWLSPSPRPKANNRNVLIPYSPSMLRLLETGQFNAGRRPSEHVISQKAFATNHGGAIPSNVLTVPNTSTNDAYQKYCRLNDFVFHPARMPIALPEFFIRFLTSPGDIVVDPFGGSNTTGAAAQALGRHWVSVEPKMEYILGSLGRFESKDLHVRRY